MSRTEKAGRVEGLASRLENAPFVAIADYRGVNVAEITAFRRNLKAAGMHYEVIKNKLALRAIEGTPLEGLGEMLAGMTGWVLSGEDPIASAKLLREETAEFKKQEKFILKGGFFDGDVLDGPAVGAVADLPSQDELFAMLLGLLQKAPQQVLGVVSAPGRDLVNLLKNYETKIAESGE